MLSSRAPGGLALVGLVLRAQCPEQRLTQACCSVANGSVKCACTSACWRGWTREVSGGGGLGGRLDLWVAFPPPQHCIMREDWSHQSCAASSPVLGVHTLPLVLPSKAVCIRSGEGRQMREQRLGLVLCSEPPS